MSGLPRSGNTLLSCILNQNPKIKVTANSLISEILYYLESLKHTDIFKNFPDNESLDNLIKNIFNVYYEKWDCEYIIDRGPWGTPANLFMLRKYFHEEIKIICPVRDILEVMSSMYHHKNNQLTNIINQWIDDGWQIPENKTLQEIKCEMMMDKNSIIGKPLFAVNNLVAEKNKNIATFIEYKDLINNTKNTIEKIYKFLNIEYFNHTFDNIKFFEINNITYNDNVLDVKNNFHHVYSSIKKSNTSIDIFEEKIISRYSNLECWRT